MTTKPTVAEVTPAVIAGWKAEHSAVFKWEAKDGKIAFFKNPDIKAIEAATVLNTSGKPIQSNKMLAQDCFLGGDPEVYTNPANLLGLGGKLQGIIKKVEGELTEL